MRKLILILVFCLLAINIFSQTTYFTDSYGNFDSGTGGAYSTKYYIIKPNVQGVFLIDFYLFNEDFCLGDYIYIYKGENDAGQLIGSYDFADYEYHLKISGQSSICIKFITNGSGNWSADYSINSLQNTNYIYTAITGSFDDGSGVSNYNNNVWNKYIIKPTNAVKVGLNFTKFNTEAGYDFVSVYDGDNDNATLLGKYDNSTPPPATITSSGGALCLIFETDGGGSFDGWAIDYSALNTIEFYYDASGNRYKRKVITYKTSNIKSAKFEPQAIMPKSTHPKEKFEENNGNQKITIYPNPTQGQLIVEIIGADLTQTSGMYIYNSTGALVAQKTLVLNSNNFDMSNLSNGVYILRIIIGNNVSEWKIIKE